MHLSVTRRGALGAGAALLLGARAGASEPAEVLTLAQVVELSGAGAEGGAAWRNGVELAVQEVNAAGGIGGRLVQVLTWDAQSNAAGTKLALAKALEIDPLAVLGPTLSEPAHAALTLPRPRGTPLIVGGGATALTGAAHPATFRSLPSATEMMTRLCRWLRDAPQLTRPALLWSGREPYRYQRDGLLAAARSLGMPLTAEWILESGPVTADLDRVLTAAPDVLLLFAGGEAAGRALAAAHRLAPRLPVVGGADLLDPRAIAAAGGVAEGVRAQVLIPPAPDAGPVAAFAARYASANEAPATELALAGYLAVGMVKAGLARTGIAEPRALAEALRGLSARDEKLLLGGATWSAAGEPDRPSWIVELRDGAPRAVATLRD